MTVADQEYPVSWIILCYVMACCNFLASALCLFAFQALIRNSSIRKNSYNIYIIFMIFPDGLQNLFNGFFNIFWQRLPQGFFEINVFVYFFYFLNNFYLNAVVAHEINILATASWRRQKTSPPELERAWKQVALVYLFATILALWPVLPYQWSPMDIDDGPNGSFKFRSPNNGGIFGPMAAPLMGAAFLGIPLLYVLYIRIRIACYKLLPKSGRTRVLSLFFMRIIIVFLLFYLPNTILTGSLETLDDNPVQRFWTANVISPLLNASQALVTLYMVMWKDDIRKAVATAWNDMCCCCCCHLATTVEVRQSAMPLRLTTSLPWGGDLHHYDVNNNPSSSVSRSPPSTSYRTEPTSLPKRSEWEQEDVYDCSLERPTSTLPHPDSTNGSLDEEVGSGSDDDEVDTPKEDHDSSSVCHYDEENPSNRDDDCTNNDDAGVLQGEASTGVVDTPGGSQSTSDVAEDE